ncbi:hypothetical protein ACFFSW_31070 [Saccharothrix longispora]|uniref:Uncharacterized protein n=1 Tax=Saccharothrix longispora TaxID=33920 RepID=A0ABU1PUC9_9PSEU|nr:hypothetical protein [Saccharothrix longispora]MDR6594229.1 hypothetical protein [Saccharothrix longispora]
MSTFRVDGHLTGIADATLAAAARSGTAPSPSTDGVTPARKS